MIAVEEMPPVSRTPDVRRARRTGVVSRGTRVYLRTLRPADLDYLSDWAEDPFLERMVGSEFLHSYKHVYDKDPSFYEACLMDPTQIVFVIVAEPRLARPARAGAAVQHPPVRRATRSSRRSSPTARAIRRGFGVQASRLIAYYGVDVLGLRRIEAKAYEYNPLSINTLKRNGFTQEGMLRKAAYRDGRYWDMLVFGILRDELEEQRKTGPVPASLSTGPRGTRVNLHKLLPLLAFLLNVSLAGADAAAQPRQPAEPRLRVLRGWPWPSWNLGVFMLRRTPEPERPRTSGRSSSTSA